LKQGSSLWRASRQVRIRYSPQGGEEFETGVIPVARFAPGSNPIFSTAGERRIIVQTRMMRRFEKLR